MKYFKEILKYASPYKLHISLNIFFNILYAFFSALSFVSMIPMLNILFGTTPKITKKPIYEGFSSLENYLSNKINYELNIVLDKNPLDALIISIFLILSLFFLKNLFNYLALFFITFLRNGILKDLRNDLYSKILELPIEYFKKRKKGDTISKLSADVIEIQTSFLSILEVLVREPLTIIFTIIMMIKVNFNLTFFALAFIPASGLLISIIGKSLKKQSDKVQKEQGEFLSIIEETLSGLNIIKAFFAEKTFFNKFSNSTNRFFHFNNNLINRQNFASPLSEFLGIIVIGSLLWYGGKLVLIENTLQASVFMSFMLLAYNILTPAKAISKASYAISKGNSAAERILSLMNAFNHISNENDSFELEHFQNEIHFKNISFSFGEKKVIDKIDLQIKKGSKVAIVGESGSGKTTLINLLNRFYDVESGEILIDGINIKKISKRSLRNSIGLVTQDPILFNDTVNNNISLGRKEHNSKEIISAAKTSNAHKFIIKMKEKYDTNIGDGGGKLSGGQKQRISIARAVLKNPQILLMDEATSSLDSVSEKMVQDAIERLSKNRTTIIVAHRLNTIQKADLIVVMENGAIIQTGTHKKLLSIKGKYKQLVEMQTFHR